MKHDTTKTVPAPGVLGNDVDLLGGATAVLDTPHPAHGAVTLRPNGGYTFQADAGYVGTDHFYYHPSGLLGLKTTVTITITNAKPTAADDTYNVVTRRSIHIGVPGVLQNDSDADGDALTAEIVDDSGSGSVDLDPDGSFTLTTGGEFIGIRRFTYRVSDGLLSSTQATVTINVRAPSATPTPPPTPTPTPPPTPTPTPPPTPTATLIIPLPSLPLPSLPLPTVTIPPLPIPTFGSTPTPTPSRDPGAGPGASPSFGASPTPSTGESPGPGSSDGGPASPRPGGNTTVAGDGPGSGTGAPQADRGALTVGLGGLGGPGGFSPIDGLTDVGVIGLDGLIEWAVPAMVLSVPGLLLLLAVLAQTLGGLLWLPVARRWLGGFGIRRRRSEDRDRR